MNPGLLLAGPFKGPGPQGFPALGFPAPPPLNRFLGGRLAGPVWNPFSLGTGMAGIKKERPRAKNPGRPPFSNSNQFRKPNLKAPKPPVATTSESSPADW